MSASIRAIRPRQISSSSVSMAVAERTAATSPLASCSRPLRLLVSRPAFSSTPTCFCTAAKLISYFAASWDTECSSASTRRRMSRRVRSASAWKRASTLSVSASATPQTYNRRVVCQVCGSCPGRPPGVHAGPTAQADRARFVVAPSPARRSVGNASRPRWRTARGVPGSCGRRGPSAASLGEPAARAAPSDVLRPSFRRLHDSRRIPPPRVPPRHRSDDDVGVAARFQE